MTGFELKKLQNFFLLGLIKFIQFVWVKCYFTLMRIALRLESLRPWDIEVVLKQHTIMLVSESPRMYIKLALEQDTTTSMVREKASGETESLKAASDSVEPLGSSSGVTERTRATLAESGSMEASSDTAEVLVMVLTGAGITQASSGVTEEE